MMVLVTSPYRFGLRVLASALLLVVSGACTDGAVAPTADAGLPTDSTVIAVGDTTAASPTDSAAPAPSDSTISPPDTMVPPPIDSSGSTGVDGPILDASFPAPGIVLGTYKIESALLGSVHTGTMHGGGLSTKNLLPLLASVRAKGGRVVLKLCNGRDSYVLNPDGTFSLTKWKALVDRFKVLNLEPYIADGTILGHYLIDEPHRPERWGKPISQATIEAMAAHSKKLWPGMATFVRVVPSWLASAPVTYTHLDAGWTQYTKGKGDAAKWVAAEAAAAKSRGLGMVVGLNVLDGGDGSSRIAGWTRGMYAMSANEIRSYGSAILNQSYACAFYMWTYDGPYFGRADIKSAMAELSVKAKAHAKTSCRQ